MDVYARLLAQETIRGERVAWIFRWVLYTIVTGLALGTMDGLYLAASPRFDAGLIAAVPSLDGLSQVYRTVFVAVCGALMLFIPGTIRRLLKAQHELFRTGQDHYEQAHADREGRAVGLLYLDLDGFKPINDRYGHDAGDRVLVEVGARLRASVRDDDLAVRVGGDEFVVVLARAEGPLACEGLAGRLAEAVGLPIALEGGEVRVGVTVGAALFPQDGRDGTTLLAEADRRMLALKGGRR